MQIADIDPAQDEFTEDELDAMIDVLEKAEAIKEDSALLKIVQRRMKSKVKSIESLADLRAVASEKAAEEY